MLLLDQLKELLLRLRELLLALLDFRQRLLVRMQHDLFDLSEVACEVLFKLDLLLTEFYIETLEKTFNRLCLLPEFVLYFVNL